ncbi:la-related protein 4-like isoform X4 [Schistocerca gregaria]|uniref:la-related protein 4-like isoform X4 n=1 Tax=Schistocerca gregaria TaxID=7010 RepID=UPI00211EAC58|nr:la-related protein 4-like isoform X4 [Schistocerca gregaria]
MADCFLPFCPAPAPVPPHPHPEFAVFYAAVTPSPSNAALNPNADVFENKAVEGTSDGSIWSYSDVDYPTEDAYVYMNGDIGKLPSGAVYPATPDSLATTATTSSDFSSLNGLGDSLETYVQDSSPPGGSLADPSPGSDAGIPLDQLKQMLSSQLEYYFSRENLANDAYLLSQMDNDQYVPIWTVANFNQVKKLTKDIKLITEVLRESPNVQVDEEGQKVRPNHKRCIVILREIPDHTPLEDVKALFSGEGCPKLISCEFAHNNSWYVTFESDEDAQRAYRFLREEVREFQGKPIMARIKAKPMNRLPIPPVPSMGVALKNGYRTPPALYDPNTYQGQQRFLYSNGSSVAPNVNFGSQVHVYTFHQQHQPFYPPNMLQPWTTASPAYFDIGSVFSVNGLAPTGSFAKPPAARYVPRNRSKRSQPIPERGSLSDSVVNVTRQSVNSHQYHPFGTGSVTTVSVTVPKTTSSSVASVGKVQPTVTSVAATTVVTATVVDSHSKSQPLQQDNGDINGPNQGTQLRTETEDSFKQRDVLTGKEPMPPRRRRREDEVLVTGRTPAVVGVAKPASSGGSPQPVNRETLSVNVRTAQFDLEATAFPPLPGLEAVTGTATKTVASVETTHAETSSSHWENRLSDVVKGTAKPKCQAGGTNGSGKEKESSSISPRGLSPVPTVPPAPSTSPAPACTPSPVAVAVAVNTETKSLPSPPQLHGTQHEREVKDVGTGSDTALSLVTLTPPSSPDKTVPVVKCMADKSTKTDDTLLNGDNSCGVAGVNLRPDSGTAFSTKQGTVMSNSTAAVPVTKHVPTTTNAATMTSAVVVTDTVVTPARQCPPTVVTTGLPPNSMAAPVASSASVPDTSAPTLAPVNASPVETACATTRLSYAQVAQHNKEKLMQRDKQSSEQQEKEREKEKKKDTQTSRGAQHNDSREQSAPREYREGQARQHMGRGGPRPVYDRDRGGLRRREGAPRYREFLRPRSPK